jgi:hypothetical protein
MDIAETQVRQVNQRTAASRLRQIMAMLIQKPDT